MPKLLLKFCELAVRPRLVEERLRTAAGMRRALGAQGTLAAGPGGFAL
jgi:hypothetical protein